MHIVVDAMNVIGSRPTGWWRDRDGAVRALLRRLQALALAEGCAITMIADGRPLKDVAEGIHDGVAVIYARRAGRDAADDRIIEFVRAHADPASLEVVTSDRELASRARAAGAAVRGASWLLELLDRATQGD
jgi:predicted RNA-binding protein with PIN domain